MRTALLTVAALTAAANGQCELQWKTVANISGGDAAIRAIASYDGALVVGGSFTSINSLTVSSLAQSRDGGATWLPLGGDVQFSDNTPAYINALLVRPDGLYATGTFHQIGGVPLVSIARWDGTQWHALDQGLYWNPYAGTGMSLFEFENKLTVCGWIFSIGTTYISHMVRWDGGAWDFFDPYATHSHGIRVATPWAGGIAAGCDLPDASSMIHWDGAQWNQLPDRQTPETLIDFHGDLYGGAFGTGGNRCVTRLVGNTWEETAPLPIPVATGGRWVYTLHIHRGDLYAGGSFRTASGAGPDYVARWNGTSWLPVGAGPGATARNLATINGDLWAGCIGRLAKYVCACPANCDNSTSPPVLNANDFQCFLNQFAAGSDYANCDGSTVPPTLNANDFQCFLNGYAAGCN